MVIVGKDTFFLIESHALMNVADLFYLSMLRALTVPLVQSSAVGDCGSSCSREKLGERKLEKHEDMGQEAGGRKQEAGASSDDIGIVCMYSHRDGSTRVPLC